MPSRSLSATWGMHRSAPFAAFLLVISGPLPAAFGTASVPNQTERWSKVSGRAAALGGSMSCPVTTACAAKLHEPCQPRAYLAINRIAHSVYHHADAALDNESRVHGPAGAVGNSRESDLIRRRGVAPNLAHTEGTRT